MHRVLAFVTVLLDGEFHDQDGVFRRQADQRHKGDLKIHVVGDAAQPDGGDGPEHAERHGGQHGERERPAFILRGEDQEDHDQREHENERTAFSRCFTSITLSIHLYFKLIILLCLIPILYYQ